MKKKGFVLALVAMFVLLIAACGGGEDSPTPFATLADPTTSVPTSTTPATQATTPAPTSTTPSSNNGGDPARGEALYNSKGCVGCHTVDGSTRVGPSWKGIYGTQEELADGSTITVDDDYIRRSISEPAAQVVKGFTAIPMTAFQFSDQENDDIIAFIKSLK
ncbi:MAG: cytochrome c oxidase subunit 2 [Chloroflexi bacterium]|nr:MAG: cytochrome c oxidase subunit 2 [Chloroflexota bacterium]